MDTSATIRPWFDPIVDRRGHDPRSAYAERFWLGVIGPSALWLMRRLADELDRHGGECDVDLADTAATMGLSFSQGRDSPFGRAIHRCVMFGLAQPVHGGFEVRRRLPSISQRHLSRLPDGLRSEHDEWIRRTTHLDHSMIERQLRTLGVSPAAAARASEAAALAS